MIMESARYIKVYTSKEYKEALAKLQEEGCHHYNGGKLIRKNGQAVVPFHFPKAIVIRADKTVWYDEIRHCPDPSDRRIEQFNLNVGDKVILTDRYIEAKEHKNEVFEITQLLMIGQTPCAFLNPSGLGAYALDGLKRFVGE